MLYNVSLRQLSKTSPRTVLRLESVGIRSIQDLLDTYPFRYEDYATRISIKEISSYPLFTEERDVFTLFNKKKVTVQGIVAKKSNVFTRRGFSMQKIIIADASGQTTLTWFNQPFLLTLFKEGSAVAVAGSIKSANGLVFLQPETYEIITEEQDAIHTGRIVPVYSAIPGVSTRTLREKIYTAIKLFGEEISEYLPEDVVKKNTLEPMENVLKELHFPSSFEAAQQARQRVSFNELFSIQLKTKLVRKEWQKQKVEIKMDFTQSDKIDKFISLLPYVLTGAQKKATNEILKNMTASYPMNRLLQGDVGSGKTIVAAAAALFAFYHKRKSLYMAPTEILAQQQFASLTSIFSALDATERPKVSLITGSSKKTTQDSIDADIVVGTHALISSKREFDNVGLVIVDEQHKFGVIQRAALKKKATQPHLLSLTATPIPRTVLLTLYGELDISTIDEFPRGRKQIKTYYIPEHKRTDAYTWIKKDLAQSHQMFVVCPFIDQSETETLQSVKSATQEADRIKNIFKEYSVALLHGRLKPAEKEDIMQRFSNGKLDILVSTPVVEVGIDVPNATIILIEGAERFGLAQLHQLRGRVGRADVQSYCLLFSTAHSEPVHKRLLTFCATHDGFELARYDLKHRGGGNIFGTQQHGYSPVALDILLDARLIAQVQDACETFIKKRYSYKDFPYLQRRLDALHIEEIAQN